jgi:hypothetical protein
MFKDRTYFNIKGLFLICIIIFLLLISAATVFAAPFLEEPDKMNMFFSWDHMGSGSFGDNSYKSFTGSSCGIAVPVGFAMVGFKTTFDTSLGYYEIFSDFNSNQSLLTNISYIHTKNKSKHSIGIIRVGAFRPMLTESSGVEFLLGPGLAATSSENATNLSMFLQGKSKIYFMEDGYFYANGLFDFMYKSTNLELGVGFSY